jgi:hypothetical protein
MEQINKLEAIFSSGSLTDLLNAVEASLLRGGTLLDDTCCAQGKMCLTGTIIDGVCTCDEGTLCASGSDY